MRRFAAISILALVLAAYANEPVASAAGSSEPGPDQTRLGIDEALSRELTRPRRPAVSRRSGS
jgi:hypothetical protein